MDILMVQRVNFPNTDAREVRRRFQEAAAAALETPKIWTSAIKAHCSASGDGLRRVPSRGN
jgi:hypothetical protein